jgi:adenine-specific DNA-methyltransferase
MAGRKSESTGKVIAAVKHKDKRKNIPTEELRGMVTEDERKPKDVVFPGLLYARDPSLDPQLVWKGKDEQDKKALTVPAVPIYIQEKIHPQAIIEDLRAEAKKAKKEDQLALFSDFNGIKFEDLIEFYRHEANWSNRMILGDSLLVMTSLAEKEGLKGQVQMIYIDPPYGIKFNSNWQVSTRKRDVKDGKAEDLTRQPEQVRAFRDTWALGIHSYLAYLRDRLVVSRELLTESGSVFVQIGDENVHLVRCVMDEVFGAENFVTLISFKKTGYQASALLPSNCDFILWYAKDKERVKYRQSYVSKLETAAFVGQDLWIKTEEGERRRLKPEEAEKLDTIPEGARIFRHKLAESSGASSTSGTVIIWGRKFDPKDGKHWSTTATGMRRLEIADRFLVIGNSLRYVNFLDDFAVTPVTTNWTDTVVSGFSDPQMYVVQTATKVVARCLLMTTDPGDLVLDPTCGSGTTAYVAEQWGRRWITCDTSRVSLALARTRLMAARFPYYVLADSPEGAMKDWEVCPQITRIDADRKSNNLRLSALSAGKFSFDIRKGFVCKRVPHITLKAIANNEEIDEIHARYQPELNALRAKLNKTCKQKWEEWEVPREIDRARPLDAPKDGRPSGPSLPEADRLLSDFWDLRRKRQAEIDASIQKNADQEILVDQPFEDNKRIRVTGPFTVESLSPHRTISVEKKRDLKEKGLAGWKIDIRGAGEFGNIIIENLRKAGVQNTRKNERLKFDTLEPFAGTWIHAVGEYEEKPETGNLKPEWKMKRVAVCIGPEHGTVGPELIKEAAKEAVKGRGFDLLLICGFAFDPHVSEEVKRYGELTVLPVRMNSDLSMGDELLKKTGAGNLFTVFGEPDMEVKKTKDDRLTVTIKGLDIYDPTTGEIRSNSTDDIACWFIDTNYNEESFFVRHAYFTGGDEPYDKLKRSLRAEIDEAAWSSLYATTSRSFDPPRTGKIAIKVINHYGDEVLKVYEVK